MERYLHSPSGSLRLTAPVEVSDWLLAFDPTRFGSTVPVGSPVPPARLVANTSTAAYEQLLAQVAQSTPTPVEFLGRPSLWHAWTAGGAIVTTPSRELVFVFVDDGVGVVGPTTSQVAMSTGVLAAAWLQQQAWRAGWHLVHGSCFVLDGAGVLCLGDKGSGKSALAIAAGRSLGADVIANDRCLLSVDSGVVRVCALPQAVAVGFGLLSALGLSPAVATAARAGSCGTRACMGLGCLLPSPAGATS